MATSFVPNLDLIVSRFHSTVHSLRELYVTMGVTQEEENYLLQELKKNVEDVVDDVYSRTLEEAKQTKESLHHKISLHMKQLQALAVQLKDATILTFLQQFESFHQESTPKTPLRLILLKMEEQLDFATKKKIQNQNILVALSDRLVSLYNMIEIEPAKRLTFDKASASSSTTTLTAEMIDNNNNNNTTVDVSADRITAFETELAAMESLKSTNTQKIVYLLSELCTLWTELQLATPVDASMLATVSVELIGSIDIEHNVVDQILAQQTQTHENLPPSNKLILAMEQRQLDLSFLKTQRLSKLQQVCQAIESLWNKLNIEEAHRQTFKATIDTTNTITCTHIHLALTELKAMEDYKKLKMQSLIEDMRVKMTGLYDVLFFSSEQRNSFIPFKSTIYNDDLLHVHEVEYARLQALEVEYTPILKLYSQREEYKKQLAEFEVYNATADPARLRSRDAFRILQYEENMRKLATKTLPALEMKLMKAISTWEAEHNGEAILIYGKKLSEEIRANQEEDSKQKTQKKKNEEEARQQKKMERIQSIAQFEKEKESAIGMSLQMNSTTSSTSNASNALNSTMSLSSSSSSSSSSTQVAAATPAKTKRMTESMLNMSISTSSNIGGGAAAAANKTPRPKTASNNSIYATTPSRTGIPTAGTSMTTAALKPSGLKTPSLSKTMTTGSTTTATATGSKVKKENTVTETPAVPKFDQEEISSQVIIHKNKLSGGNATNPTTTTNNKTVLGEVHHNE